MFDYYTGALPISIHALREEGDLYCPAGLCCLCSFLSTPSARRATCNAWSHGVAIGISIHALREEGDCFCCWV